MKTQNAKQISHGLFTLHGNGTGTGTGNGTGTIGSLYIVHKCSHWFKRGKVVVTHSCFSYFGFEIR